MKKIEIDATSITLMGREAAIRLAFNLSPDDSYWPPEHVAIITDHEESHLASLRTRGGGPRFRKGTKKVWYTKRAVMEWLESSTVEARNTAEADASRGVSTSTYRPSGICPPLD